MIRFLTVLLLLFSTAIHAADITITGPMKPINPGRMVRLLVSGLTDQELMRSSASVSLVPTLDGPITVSIPLGEKNAPIPLDGVDIFPGKTWDNRPYIDFMSQSPGKFSVAIDVNLFRMKLDAGLAATEAAEIDEQELVSDLKSTVVKIRERYFAKSGSCVVEVAGAVPFPPTDPKPPLPPTTKVDRVTYVYEKDLTAIPRPVEFALQRLNKESSNSIIATVFEEDSTVDGAPNGRTPSQYVVALKAAREAGLPSLVVQTGETVVRVVKAPTTEAAVMEAAK